MRLFKGDYFGDNVLVFHSYSFGTYSYGLLDDYVIQFDQVLIDRNEGKVVKRL